MWLTILLGALGLFAIALFAVLLINRFRLDRENAKLVEELLGESSFSAPAVFSYDDLEGLPEPVRNYLKNAITEGQPYLSTARLDWTGEFRLGDESAAWKSFAAMQHFAVQPPGFIWDAAIEMAPLIKVRVVDMYKDGEGALRAKLASTFSVADEPSSAELNSGELMRYLAETIWFPTALLPGQGVEWSGIDDRSSRATIQDGDTRVSLVFHFNSRNEVERVVAERWYLEADSTYKLTPWTGTFHNYQTRNGLLIPQEGEVEWNLAEGNLAYWRGVLVRIDYDIVE